MKAGKKMLRADMVRIGVMGALLALTAGCITDRGEVDIASSSAAARANDTIKVTAGPCLGFCPSYSVTVTPDGSGLLVPTRSLLLPGRNMAVPGPTRFTVTVAQYRKLRASLAAFRPTTGQSKRIGHGENCVRFATDMPGYEIEWTRQGAGKTELNFQSGCLDARYTRLRAALSAMPKVLEIEPMLKPKTPVKG
jgi:hypothetical protein